MVKREKTGQEKTSPDEIHKNFPKVVEQRNSQAQEWPRTQQAEHDKDVNAKPTADVALGRPNALKYGKKAALSPSPRLA